MSPAAADVIAAAAAAQPIPKAPRDQRIKDVAFRALMLTCLGIAMLTLAVILIQLAAKGAGSISAGFFENYGSSFPESAGIRGALLGTVWVMGVCAAFIVPVGVASAIYLEEYADRTRWYNRFIEVNIQNLAAVPSIIYGILGLAFLVRGPLSFGRVVLAGGLTLGLLVLPVVIIAAREAIRAVPPSIREGSMALGATKWQTIRKQVLPAAIGETAPVLLVATATYVPFDPSGLDSSYTVLPLQAFSWITQPQAEFQNLAAAAILVLMGVLLLMNAVAIWLRNRYEGKW
jgi:phosphate transport system permease protein